MKRDPIIVIQAKKVIFRTHRLNMRQVRELYKGPLFTFKKMAGRIGDVYDPDADTVSPPAPVKREADGLPTPIKRTVSNVLNDNASVFAETFDPDEAVSVPAKAALTVLLEEINNAP